MERTRTLIAAKDREHLTRSLERLSAGLALRREDGRARLVRAEPPDVDPSMPECDDQRYET